LHALNKELQVDRLGAYFELTLPAAI